MIHPPHLRLVIGATLTALAPAIPFSENAVTLLCMTAAHESDCGRYLKQIKGPARGVFQMEPATTADHYRWMRDKRADIFAAVERFRPVALTPDDAMIGCIPFAAAMARVHYFRRPQPVPSSLEDMARWAKAVFNTELGAAKWTDYLDAYRKYFG